MTEELKVLCIILVTCVPVGLVIGVVVRKLRPDWCKSYAKYCMNGKWWIFAFGVFLFAGSSIMSFVQNRPYFGILFMLFAFGEAVALFAFGFKRLTPEQATNINASDPTKLWPLRFWNQTTNGEKNGGP
jgi:hypothetical protein